MTFKTFFPLFFLMVLFSCKETPAGSKASANGVSETDTTAILERGNLLAQKTQQTLGSTLKKKIAEGGLQHAIAFCNLRALPLTDSISKAHHVEIQRLTDKPRNALNQADNEALEVMERFRAEWADGKELKGVLLEKEDHIETYYPIVTSSLCLQCHGTPGETLQEATLSSILERYPADKATGYKEGALRGLWSIRFEKQ